MEFKGKTREQLLKEIDLLKVEITELEKPETERKQAEEELKESEESYRGLFNNATEAIYIQDKDGFLVDVNDGAVEMYGYPREFFIGKTPEFLSAPGKNDMKKVFEMIQKAFTGVPQQYEFYGLRKNGEVFIKDVQLNSGTYFGEQVIIAYARDITERKKAENIQKALYNISNAVNTSETFEGLYKIIRSNLGTVIDTTNFFVALYDEENDTLSLPFEVDEIDFFKTFPAGKTLTSLVIKTGKPIFANKQLQDKLAKQGKIDIIETRSEIWLGVPLKIENKVMGVIAVQSYDDPNLYTEKDIEILSFVSEEIALAIKHKQARNNFEKAHEELKGLHKNLQKKVAKAVKDLRKKDLIIYQQSRLASLGEMICNIAHHWRQPITAVGVIIQSYEDAFEDGTLDMDYIEKHTDIIMDILTKMSRTIDNFRFFFKPDKAKENFDLKEIILKTLLFLESSFKYNKINVSSDLAEDCIINGFPNEFSQVLLVIFANNKDELVERNIKKRKIKITLKKIEDKCVLKISDNAGGITKEVLPKIFDPYFTTKEEGKGIGVGLYMAKMIIEKNMGGKLTARNIKNGEEFRIEV